MKKITPHLWYDTQAKEAAAFYTSLFPKSRVTDTSVIHDVPTPTGDCDIVSFELAGHPFMAINAGPMFTKTPAISFILNFDPSKDSSAKANLEKTWQQLLPGGKPLMPLDKYPFSEKYGWIQDKYGLSWQLILTDPKGEPRPFVIPSMLFTRDVAGRAEEAIDFYCSVFKDGKRGQTARYPKGMEPEKEGSLMFAEFHILSTWMAAMDSRGPHEFGFNEGVSLVVPCDTQQEIDYYWDKLSHDPNAEQCGWLKDKFGVSWQVWPTVQGEMLKNGTPEQIARVVAAFMPMKKFDIATLKRAYEGKGEAVTR